MSVMLVCLFQVSVTYQFIIIHFGINFVFVFDALL